MADYLGRRRSAVPFIDPLVPDGIAISFITFAEVYEGIYFGRNPDYFEAVFRQFLRGIAVLDISQDVAKICARLRGTLRQSGRLIPHPDLFIAATALHYNLTLVSRNRRHFERIPDLKLMSEPPDQSTL